MLLFKTYLQYLLHVENIRKQYKNKTLKIIASTWNDEFELPDDDFLFCIRYSRLYGIY